MGWAPKEKRRRWYYAKDYCLGGYYKDFLGSFEIYKFPTKKKRDEWVSQKPYDSFFNSGRMEASGNDYARDPGEHKTVQLRYLSGYYIEK